MEDLSLLRYFYYEASEPGDKPRSCTEYKKGNFRLRPFTLSTQEKRQQKMIRCKSALRKKTVQAYSKLKERLVEFPFILRPQIPEGAWLQHKSTCSQWPKNGKEKEKYSCGFCL